MGFYVPTNRDVKFPKACEQCHFYDGLLCCVLDTYVHDPENKHEECPLIEIPDNHGRLIDADALAHEFEEAEKLMDENGLEFSCSFLSASQEIATEWYCVEDMLENAPTVIPKDEMV